MRHYFDMPLDYMTKRVRDLPEIFAGVVLALTFYLFWV